MEKKSVKILLKIVRLLLAVGASALCFLPNSYRNPVLEPETMKVLGYEYVNFFARSIRDNGNMLPLICALLSMSSVVIAVVCLFQETEKTLTWMAGVFCLAMTVGLLNMIMFGLTPIGWAIIGLAAIGMALTACQEIQLEKKNMA